MTNWSSHQEGNDQYLFNYFNIYESCVNVTLYQSENLIFNIHRLSPLNTSAKEQFKRSPAPRLFHMSFFSLTLWQSFCSQANFQVINPWSVRVQTSVKFRRFSWALVKTGRYGSMVVMSSIIYHYINIHYHISTFFLDFYIVILNKIGLNEY
jgi:hypothetical protein